MGLLLYIIIKINNKNLVYVKTKETGEDMKKFKLIFTIFVVCLFSVIFASCGAPYKNLEMIWNSDDEMVRIVLDSDYWTNKGEVEKISSTTAQVKVSFKGIKQKKIGELDIQVVPADLAQIQGYELIGKVAKFNVSAIRSGRGSIVVTHLSANKSLEIPLHIDKKATGVTSLGQTIVLGIPNEGENKYSIETSKLINFLPGADCTDTVAWRFDSETINQISSGEIIGLSLRDEETEDEEVKYEGSKIVVGYDYANANGTDLKLKPILKQDGYDDEEQNVEITLKVQKLLDVENIKTEVKQGIWTKDGTDNKDFDDETEAIKLFVNNSKYNYAKVVFNLVETKIEIKTGEDGIETEEKTEIKTNILESEELKEIYDFNIRNVVSSSVECIEIFEDENGTAYKIMSPTATKEDEWVLFSYEPKNVIGDVKTFTKKIKLDLTKTAEEVRIKEDGELLETESKDENTRTTNITLLDYYKFASGSKFNFSVGDSYADEAVQKLKIKVNKTFLSDENYENASINKNQYLLEFTKGSTKITTWTESGGYFYSEAFSPRENIYIKYVWNSKGETADELSFSVINEYDGVSYDKAGYTEDFLKDSKTLELTINRTRGISELTLDGIYIKPSNAYETIKKGETCYILNSAINSVSDCLDTNKLKTDKHAYGIYAIDIKGADGKTISDRETFDLTFTLSRSGGDQYTFDLYSYFQTEFSSIPSNHFNLDWKTVDLVAVEPNALCFFKDDGTILDGEYTLTLTQEKSGTSASYTFYVVTNVSKDNLEIDVAQGAGIYSGTNYDGYENGSIIAPIGTSLLTELRLGSTENSEFNINESLLQNVTGLTVSSEVGKYSGEDFVKADGKKSGDYLAYQEDFNKATEFKSVKTGKNSKLYLSGAINTKNLGTKFLGEIYYIKVSYTIECLEFELGDGSGFYKLSKDVEKATKELLIFIYVPISGAYLSVDNKNYVDTTTAYYGVGAYYENLAQKTFELKLKSNKATNEDIFDYLTSCQWGAETSSFMLGDGKGKTETFSFQNATNQTPRIIKAKISQFGFSMTLPCQVNLIKPTITKQIVLRNPTNMVNNKKYIHTSVGKTLTLNVDKIGVSDSNFNEIYYVVCDAYNTLYTGYTINEKGELENSDGKITIDKAIDLHVYIVAKEWLKSKVEVEGLSFSDINTYLVADAQNKAIDIYLRIRDGSKNNPLLITSTDDLEDAKNSDKYFELANDINMSGIEINLGTFKGNLSSFKDYVLVSSQPDDWGDNYNNYYVYDGNSYKQNENSIFRFNAYFELKESRFTLYNLSYSHLDGTSSYSFIDTLCDGAEISNINFKVKYSNTGENALSCDGIFNFGLVGTNCGMIKNVSVTTDGNVAIVCKEGNLITCTHPVNFGGIAGTNDKKGTIMIDDATIIASSGGLSITKLGNIYIGGVAGENKGTISGVLASNATASEIEYVTIFYGNQGSMFDGEFQLNMGAENFGNNDLHFDDDDDEKPLKNDTSAMGGVVGKNSAGSVYDVYVSGSLRGVLNVGGVIGYNDNGKDAIASASSTSNIRNIQSVATVEGVRRVGGIVGLDKNGTYYHVYYEVYEDGELKSSKISGTNYVGGLIGYTVSAKMSYSYFNSFRWAYNFDDKTEFKNSEFYNKKSDIKGNSYVGGLIGYAVGNSMPSLSDGSVKIDNSIFNGYLQADNDTENTVAGLIGYSAGAAEGENVICQGAIISKESSFRLANGDNKDGSYSDITRETGSIAYKVYYGTDKTFATNNANITITLDGNPLITQTPTGVNMSDAVKTDINADIGTSKFKDENENDISVSSVIVLYYYDLIDDESANYKQDKQTKNTVELNNILNKDGITLTPSDLKVARLRVESSNVGVIKVLADGKILLLGEGEVVLKFISVYNSSVCDSIKIFVIKKTSSYDIYKNSALTDDLNETTINLVKDNSMFIYEKYSNGTVNVNNSDYSYNTSSNVAVKFKFDPSDEILSINGEKESSYIYDKASLILKAEKFSSDKVEVSLKPYLVFKNEETKYYVELGETKTFDVVTKEGVKALNTDVFNATLAQADNMDLTFTIETDEKMSEITYSISVKDQAGKNKKCYDINGKEIDDFKILLFNSEKCEYKLTLKNDIVSKDDKTIQTETFNLTINKDIIIEEDVFISIRFYCGNKYCDLNLTLIPQRINTLHITNMKNNTNGWERSTLIRPNAGNMLILELAPSSAYYGYIEISDLTGSEALKFMQYDRFDSSSLGLGGAIRLSEEVSSDGLGIRLTKTGNIAYVYAILAIDSEINQTHRIKATAYSSSGIELGSNIFLIEAVVYPTVILTYHNSKDNTVINDSRKNNNEATDVNLAFGVEAKISAETKNIDNLEWGFSVDVSEAFDADLKEEDIKEYLSLTMGNDGNMYLKWDFGIMSKTAIGNLRKNALGATIQVTATAQKYTNGHLEETQAMFKFIVREYTIDGVSIKSKYTTSNNRVAGIIGEETQIEFYFNKTDLSYFDTSEMSYWKNVYTYDNTKETGDDKINDLLGNINKLSTGVSFYLSDGDKDISLGDLTSCPKDLKDNGDRYSYCVNDISYIDFKKRGADTDEINITINKSQMNNYYFKVKLTYYYENNILTWGTKENTPTVEIVSNLGINFTEYTSQHEYKKIESLDDFMNMVSEQYYILTTDLDLSNYIPLDIELGGFDGNGHTITIKSFDIENITSSASDGIGNFALFVKIYEGEILFNLTLDYANFSADFSEYELSSGGYFNEVNFAGIANTNEGIISNTQINGRSIHVLAGKVSPANFNTASIVNSNLETGFISNSTSEAIITTTGNVAGIANNNYGKISTTRYLGTLKSYYLASSSYVSNIEMAGFVITNTGEIHLSYVKSKTLEAGSSIGGLVYKNSGGIYDSYTNIDSFSSYGQIGALVYESSGEIMRCYTKTKIVTGRDKKEFVFKDSSGSYEDCYFITEKEVVSEVDGVKCITTSNARDTRSYNNFIFATSEYGVWTISSEGPLLENTLTSIKTKSNAEISYDGTRENPYLIYDIESFNYLKNLNIDGYLYGYFRVVADIDFDGETPESCEYIFAGQLEGNNMTLSNFSLYSAEKVTSLGLFKGVGQSGLNDGFLRNLELKPSNVRASTASMVGVLAGYIDSGRVYNVHVYGENIAVLGVNAVGGIAGIIKGSFELNGLSSNVNVKSNYGQLYNSNNLYLSKNVTGIITSSNIDKVSYAGGIAGIVDGYDNRISTSVSIGNYYKITNCKISENANIVGGTVGGLFGLLAERSMLENVTFNVGENAYLKGYFTSGGIVGENRGIIYNASLYMAEDKYDFFDYEETGSYANVNGGIVGTNYGGLIYNAKTNANIIHSLSLATVGGIAGRNSNGVIVNPTFTGSVYGMFASAIVGTDYRYDTLTYGSSSQGAISSSTYVALPKTLTDYSGISFGDYAITKDLSYQNINVKMLNDWFNGEITTLRRINKSLSDFYSEVLNVLPEEITFNTSRVLATVVALTDKDVYTVNYHDENEKNLNSDFIEVLLKDDPNDPKTLESGIEKIPIDTTKFIPTKTTIKDESTERTGADGTVTEVYYSEFQEYLSGHLSEKASYYYFVAVTDATFEFWNSNGGYSNGVVYGLNFENETS